MCNINMVALITVLTGISSSAATEFTAEAYRNPPAECSPGYFWMWNTELKPEMLFAQLDDMKANGIDNVCIHPFPAEFRPSSCHSSMSPKYLSPEYVDIYAQVVRHAAKLGMCSWLYDEGGWPSGSAAGQVAESDKEGRFRQYRIGRGEDGRIKVWQVSYKEWRTNFPSVIEPGATERFIELTHAKLARQFQDELGKTVKFAFTDEPEVPHHYLNEWLPWASDFAEQFKARKGYDIMPHMAEVLDSFNDIKSDKVGEIILDYKEVLGDLFIERYLLPLRRWCSANKMLSGGHFNGEDEPSVANTLHHNNLLKDLRALDVPGVDVIWRQLWPSQLGNFGRQVPFPRYAASAAHYNGTPYVLTESFGIFGNSLTPKEMKWCCDYQMVRGCNDFVFAYYAVSNAGQWMALFEPHSGPVSPFWNYSRPFFEYLKRTCGLLSKGHSAAEIVVYYDQRSFWMGGAATSAAMNRQFAVANSLDAMNCDYDFADDDVFERATIEGNRLVCGKMRYSTVVVPAWGKITARAKARLQEFAKQGGCVLMANELERVPRTCHIVGSGSENMRVLKRVSEGAALYFIVNERDAPIEGLELTFAEQGEIVRCDPESGKFVSVKSSGGSFKWNFDAIGSELFIVGVQAEVPAPATVQYDYHKSLTLDAGWTLQPITQHLAGKKDLEIRHPDAAPMAAELGDWRALLGYDFSGTATYRVTFQGAAGKARLDLGEVKWAASARLNGKPLSLKFVCPYIWEVELKDGENTLEVTVANSLANALGPEEVRDRIARDFPPRSSYDIRQRPFDNDNHPSGLFGPVSITPQIDAH